MLTDFYSISNSSKLSLHLVGGYGILAIPTKSAVLSCQSGYGRDAIPSYRLPLIYKDKYERILKHLNILLLENGCKLMNKRGCVK